MHSKGHRMIFLIKTSIVVYSMFITQLAHAVIVSKTPTADAFVRSDQPGSNFGESSLVGAAKQDSPSIDVRSYINFDLSDIPSGSTINSAKLKLYCATECAGGYVNINLNSALSAWVEKEITWDNKPAVASAGPFGRFDASSNYSWYEWDIMK